LKKAFLNILLALAFLSEGCSWFRRDPKPSPPPAPPPTQPAKQAPAAGAKKRPAARKPPPALKEAPQPDRPPPILGELMTEEERAQYRHAYEVSAGEANRILSSFSTRKLVADQMETVGRIRSFLRQAADATATDLSLAANLARRAALLANELAARVE